MEWSSRSLHMCTNDCRLRSNASFIAKLICTVVIIIKSLFSYFSEIANTKEEKSNEADLSIFLCMWMNANPRLGWIWKTCILVQAMCNHVNVFSLEQPWKVLDILESLEQSWTFWKVFNSLEQSWTILSSLEQSWTSLNILNILEQSWTILNSLESLEQSWTVL